MFMNFSAMVLRLALAVVFGFAAYVKLDNPQAFMLSIDAFDLVPEHVTKFLAFFMPWTEMVCAALLLIGWRSRAAALVLWGTLIVFIGAIISAMYRDMVLKCGCFGEYGLMCEPGLIGWCNVLQNCLLAAACVVVLFWGPGYLSVDEPGGRPKSSKADDLDD